MTDPAHERYQLAGLDDRERGFNREVVLYRQNNAYQASFRYEQVQLTSEPAETPADALSGLIRTLHAKGYRQIRSRLSFRGDAYLGSQEPWTEYPDPQPPSLLAGLFQFLRRFLPGFQA